jgi:hypothetical protein
VPRFTGMDRLVRPPPFQHGKAAFQQIGGIEARMCVQPRIHLRGHLDKHHNGFIAAIRYVESFQDGSRDRFRRAMPPCQFEFGAGQLSTRNVGQIPDRTVRFRRSVWREAGSPPLARFQKPSDWTPTKATRASKVTTRTVCAFSLMGPHRQEKGRRPHGSGRRPSPGLRERGRVRKHRAFKPRSDDRRCLYKIAHRIGPDGCWKAAAMHPTF